MFSLFLFNFLCHLVMCPVAIKKTTSAGAVCTFITQNCQSCSVFTPSVPWLFHDIAALWERAGFQECNFFCIFNFKMIFLPPKRDLCSTRAIQSTSLLRGGSDEFKHSRIISCPPWAKKLLGLIFFFFKVISYGLSSRKY